MHTCIYMHAASMHTEIGMSQGHINLHITYANVMDMLKDPLVQLDS